VSERRSKRQLIGSLLVALAIVAVVIVAVTARLGPTSIAELDAREDRIDAVQERADSRADAREKRLEQQAEAREERQER
jgi:hypothetical protein